MFHKPQTPYELPDTESPSLTVLPTGLSLKDAYARGRWKVPALVFLVSAVVFLLFAWERGLKKSPDTHFVYLANTYNSMIASNFSDEAAKRREDKVPFELDKRPHHRNDWASYWDFETRSGERFEGVWMDKAGHGRFRTLDGKAVVLEQKDLQGAKRKQRFFVSFPPAPAFVMMPLAAIWGYDVNDVLFTIFFAAMNVMLMFLLLRRLSEGGRTGRGRRENLWLTALFGFGTAHLWCSVLGQVWFTALIVGITFTLLYIYFAIDAKHPFLAGLALAFAFSTRTPLVFGAVFFYAFLLFPGGVLRKENWKEALIKGMLFSLPCLVIGVALLAMNYSRFESWTEFGHRYLATGGLKRIQTYGLFNIQFLSKNLTAAFTLLPRFQPSEPFVIISKHGMSLLLTTPAFIYLFRPLARTNNPDRFWWRLLWLTVFCVGAPAMLYQNTGYEQFGFRFSLDYTPYLILLLAVGRRPLSWVFKLLVVLGIGANAFGAVTFKRIHKFYSEEFFV